MPINPDPAGLLDRLAARNAQPTAPDAEEVFPPTAAEVAAEARTPDLVREFAELKAWFRGASIGGWSKSKLAAKKHVQLGVVVDELRKRGILD